MSARADRWIIVAALVCLAIGVALSRLVEPGVRVESVRLGGDVPALRFIPSGAGPHPVALLAHGVTASKETLFRFGEALAAAGFECYAVDLPGHGASLQRFGFRRMPGALEDIARSIGPVDVFLGHSMGAYVGGGAVRDGGLRPKLFIAVGALPSFGTNDVPLLLLAGEWEEAISPVRLKSRADARLVLFPYCDHAFEPYDPALVNTAVRAACDACSPGLTGEKLSLPLPPARWILRWLGLLLGMAGVLILALRLPALPPRWAWTRGPLVALMVIAGLVLTANTWFGVTPHLRRLPIQLVIMVFTWLAILGTARLRVPRWSFAAVAVAIALACMIGGAHFLGLIAAIGALIFFAGRVIGWIAARRGSLRDGDLAAAIVVGYALGQLVPF